VGYRPPPPPPEYGAPCELCFPSAKTPAQMLASFSGIEPCHGGIPGIYGNIPQNILLTNTGGCEWSGSAGPTWWCSYNTAPGGSAIWLAADDGAGVFSGVSSSPCSTTFQNKADCAFPATYIASKGNCQLTWRADVLASIKAICELVGFPNDLLTKFDVTPVDETYCLFHFYREGWARDLLVKIDMTAL